MHKKKTKPKHTHGSMHTYDSTCWAWNMAHLARHLEVCQVQVFLELLLIQVQQVASSDAIALKGAAIPNAYLTQQLHSVCHRVPARTHSSLSCQALHSGLDGPPLRQQHDWLSGSKRLGWTPSAMAWLHSRTGSVDLRGCKFRANMPGKVSYVSRQLHCLC